MSKLKIKDTEEYKRLFAKYGARKNPITFLHEWFEWSEYRRWQELEGIRKVPT